MRTLLLAVSPAGCVSLVVELANKQRPAKRQHESWPLAIAARTPDPPLSCPVLWRAMTCCAVLCSRYDGEYPEAAVLQAWKTIVLRWVLLADMLD